MLFAYSNCKSIVGVLASAVTAMLGPGLEHPDPAALLMASVQYRTALIRLSQFKPRLWKRSCTLALHARVLSFRRLLANFGDRSCLIPTGYAVLGYEFLEVLYACHVYV